MASDEKELCPLCMEAMEADDLAFYPCDCRYQVCRFCWARIINEENGLCPACRKEYNSEQPALYKPISDSEDAKVKYRKRKDQLKKTKLTAEMLKLLPELRVVQPNLIFVVGLPSWICKDKEILKGPDYFGRYGKVFKVEINQNQTFGGPQGQPSFSAYITYCRAEDAMRSIRELDQGMIHGRPLRVSLGTTKYCSQFLRGAKCTKHECMYLHELGDPAASFTKEEMQAGKHTEYMNKLLVDYVSSFDASSSLANDQQSLESSVSTACNHPADSEPRRPSTSKETHHSHNFSRGTRNRADGAHSNTHRSHTKRSNDTDFHGAKNSHGDNRRSRNHRSDCYSYSGGNLVESTASANQSGVWDSSDYDARHTSQSAARAEEANLCVNGYADSDNPGDSSRKTNDHRYRHSVRVESNVATHATNIPESSTRTTESDWHQRPPPCDSTTHLNDEPLDIGFDPFRESQQGLAELLATEMGKVSMDEGLRNFCAQTRLCVPRSQLDQLLPVSAMGTRIPNSDTDASRLQWENSSSGDAFSSRAYPPPGFEEGSTTCNQTMNASSFFSISESLQSPSTVASYPTFSFMGLNNGTVTAVSDSIDGTSSFHPLSHHTTTNVDFHSQSRGMRADNPSDYHNYEPSISLAVDPNSRSDLQQQQQQQQQAIAELFAAAFQTASAMLANRVSGSNDPKSTNKHLPPFDLNAFFTHLCRQSPIFSSFNSNATPNFPPEHWNGLTAPSTHWEQPSMCGDGPSSLVPPANTQHQHALRMPPKSVECDAYRQERLTFANCTPASLAPNSDSYYFNSETRANKESIGVSSEGFKLPFDSTPSTDSFTNTGQPCPSWKQVSATHPPTDLLQQIWQPSTAVQSSFENHLQTSFSSQTDESGTLSPRPVLREPPAHKTFSSSHAQSAK